MISERTPKYDFHDLLHHADMTRTKDILVIYEQVRPLYTLRVVLLTDPKDLLMARLPCLTLYNDPVFHPEK